VAKRKTPVPSGNRRFKLKKYTNILCH